MKLIILVIFLLFVLLGFKIRKIWNHSKEHKMLNYTDVDSISTTMSCDSMGFLLNLPEISLLHLESGNKLSTLFGCSEN